MYGFVYMTTNNINGMKYIGMHKSDDMNDNYLGSGVALHKAIKQYGKENFTRIILDTAEDYFDNEFDTFCDDYEYDDPDYDSDRLSKIVDSVCSVYRSEFEDRYGGEGYYDDDEDDDDEY